MVIDIPLAKIEQNPWQTRLGEPSPEYIKELALDIAANGLLQRPVARRRPGDIVDGSVQLAFGHNRLAAFRWLNDVQNNSNIQGDWSAMPVELRELTDEQMALLAWSENEKRRDVTPIERATAIQRRMTDFGWTNRQCAEALGIDHSSISNILRLLKLPANVQEALSAGNMSERQAMALLPLFDIPEKAELYDDSYYYLSPSKVIKNAIDGGMSSGAIRESVDQSLKSNSRDLAKAEFKRDQLIPEGNGVYCGLCSTCDKRMASRNLCFDKECYDAKTKYIHRKYLERASLASGYPIMDAEKGGYPTGLTYYQAEKIIASKCPHLVVQYTERPEDKGSPTRIEGHPHAMIVCDKRNQSCTCAKGLASLADMSISKSVGEMPAKDASELEDAARAARKAKVEGSKLRPVIREQLEAQLLADLKLHRIGALYAVTDGYLYPSERDLEEDRFYKMLAHKAATRIIPDDFSSASVSDIVERTNRVLEHLQLDRFEFNSETEPA